MSATMQNGISEVYADLEKLQESSKITQSTMSDVSNGATDTANAVQNQLTQTDAIQKKVELVDMSANEISASMAETLISLHRAVKILSILLLQLIYLLRTEKWLLISLLTLTTIFHRCILLLL